MHSYRPLYSTYAFWRTYLKKSMEISRSSSKTMANLASWFKKNKTKQTNKQKMHYAWLLGQRCLEISDNQKYNLKEKNLVKKEAPALTKRQTQKVSLFTDWIWYWADFHFHQTSHCSFTVCLSKLKYSLDEGWRLQSNSPCSAAAESRDRMLTFNQQHKQTEELLNVSVTKLQIKLNLETYFSMTEWRTQWKRDPDKNQFIQCFPLICPATVLKMK